MRFIPYLVTAFVTAAICFGIVAAQSHAQGANLITVRPGAYVKFVGLDFACDFVAHNSTQPDHGLPYIYCNRSSLAVNSNSRAVIVTPYHYAVTRENGMSPAYLVSRAP